MPVEVNCFILADGAQEADGKLYVLGGGWDRLTVKSLPAPLVTAALAIVLSVPWNEANETIRFEIFLVHEDEAPGPEPWIGGELVTGRPADAVPGMDLPVRLAFPTAGVVLKAIGGHAFVLMVNGQEKARAKFRVVEAPISVTHGSA